MAVVRDDFREALLQAGRQESFMRIKWYVFAIGAFFAYGRLLCHELLSSGEVSPCCCLFSSRCTLLVR